jgi:hypothetical protein
MRTVIVMTFTICESGVIGRGKLWSDENRNGSSSEDPTVVLGSFQNKYQLSLMIKTCAGPRLMNYSPSC